jgi:hypothetical protein
MALTTQAYGLVKNKYLFFTEPTGSATGLLSFSNATYQLILINLLHLIFQAINFK